MAIQSVCMAPDVEAIARMSMKYRRNSIAEIHRDAHAALPRIGVAATRCRAPASNCMRGVASVTRAAGVLGRCFDVRVQA